jgi:hypothetical protein
MEVGHSSLELGKCRWTIATADEERTGIPEHAVHVSNQLMWRSDFRSRSKRSEFPGSATERLLRPVRQSSQKMMEKGSLLIHFLHAHNSWSIITEAVRYSTREGFQFGSIVILSSPCPIIPLSL